MNIKILIIAGTRPELIKLAPLIKKIEKNPLFSMFFLHSGQHYNKNLFIKLLEDFDLPYPDYNIEVGSGTHGYQTGFLIQEIEKKICEINPDLVISQGDTNTVLASSIATIKLNKCFMHLEAGIRSYDKQMPEEINRLVTGVCSMYHLAPTERAAINLLFEGIPRNRIFIVGNTIVDSILYIRKIAEKKSRILNLLKLNNLKPFVLITLHRAENVDNKKKLFKLINKLSELKSFQFVFPLHPRTKKKLKEFNYYKFAKNICHIKIIEPLGYLDFIKIFSNSLCVITDSGGIQEESTILRIPCITLRNNTERPETIEFESNILIGMDMEKLESELMKIILDSNYLTGKSKINPFGDGNTATRIIRIIIDLHERNQLNSTNSELWRKIPKRNLMKIMEKDKNSTVEEFERSNNVKIQLIFDKCGNPNFPYNYRKLKKDENLLINIK